MRSFFKVYYPSLRYILVHKWYVLVECWKRGIYWRGIAHDMSKLRPSEFIPYSRYFFDDKKNREEFLFAKVLHQNRNRHHWLWWVTSTCKGMKALPIPEPYITEIICDLIGSGKAQGRFSPKEDPLREAREWWEKYSPNMILHPDTRKEIDRRFGLSG